MKSRKKMKKKKYASFKLFFFGPMILFTKVKKTKFFSQPRLTTTSTESEPKKLNEFFKRKQILN
jgi:hypothetical protein